MVTQIIGIDGLRSRISPLPVVAVVDVMRAFTTAAVVLGYSGVHPGDVALCLDLDRFSFAMVATVVGQDLVVRAVR